MASSRDLPIQFGSMSVDDVAALNSYDNTDPILMPASPTTTSGTTIYTPATTNILTPTVSKRSSPSVFIVLQHSESAGRSALLPQSKVLGVFATEEKAMFHLHLQKVHRDVPVIKDKTPPGSAGSYHKSFWCSSAGERGDEWGYRYKSEGGEEFVVWIEEHDVVS